MPHNMTPPLALPDPPDARAAIVDFPSDRAPAIPVRPAPHRASRKTPPVEDLALMLVVIGFVIWSIAFAYRMAG